MFSSAAFAQTHSTATSESSEDMTAKRARVEASAQSFEAIDVNSISVKVVDTKIDQLYFTIYDQKEVEIIMHPKEPGVALRRFDMQGDKERTKFNSNDPEAKGNRLSVYVTLDEEQAKFVEAASEHLKALLAMDESVE